MMKYRRIFGFISISMILSILLSPSLNAVVAEDNAINDALNDFYDKPVDINSDDVFFNHIKELCPNITSGELNAIVTVMRNQLEENSDSNVLKFYIAYLNKSDDCGIGGFHCTAQQLYDNSPFYRSNVIALDRIIMTYGHMSRDQKVEFLKTEYPNTNYIENFFLSQPKTDKAKFIWVLNATKSNMDTYQSEISNVYTGDAFKIEEKIGVANEHFATALYTQSLNYDLDYGDGLIDNNIFWLMNNASAVKKLDDNQRKELKIQIMSKAASINAAAYSIMGVTAAINIIITALDIVLPSICSAGVAASVSIVAGIIAMMLFAIASIIMIIVSILSVVVNVVLGVLSSNLFKESEALKAFAATLDI